MICPFWHPVKEKEALLILLGIRQLGKTIFGFSEKRKYLVINSHHHSQELF